MGRKLFAGCGAALLIRACCVLGGSILATTILATGALAFSPEPRACPQDVGAGVTCHTARDVHGAHVLMARPANWNGSLIVHIYGGPRMRPPSADMTDEDLVRFVEMVREGYAWVATSRRRGGYGVTQGAEDADNARKLYIAAFGQPKLTIVHGQSWGGNVGAVLIETFNRPDAAGKRPYDGALLTSGVLAGGTRSYDMRLDLRAAFQVVCKTHPKPDEPAYHLGIGLPQDAKLSRKDVEDRFNACTGANKKAEERTQDEARALADLSAASRLPADSLPGHLGWATFVFRDISRFVTNGQSPFGNIDVVYRGTSDDAAFNAAVPRLAAAAEAKAALAADSDPTGRIDIPVLTLHAVRDTTAFVEHESEYRRVVEAAGNGERLVQMFVDDNQHSKMSPPHYPAALAALRGWIETGQRPDASSIAARCEAARTSYPGDCRFMPGYQPGPWASRVNPR
jgi:hypothetical protein